MTREEILEFQVTNIEKDIVQVKKDLLQVKIDIENILINTKSYNKENGNKTAPTSKVREIISSDFRDNAYVEH